jgi:hypothetical protein
MRIWLAAALIREETRYFCGGGGIMHRAAVKGLGC